MPTTLNHRVMKSANAGDLPGLESLLKFERACVIVDQIAHLLMEFESVIALERGSRLLILDGEMREPRWQVGRGHKAWRIVPIGGPESSDDTTTILCQQNQVSRVQ